MRLEQARVSGQQPCSGEYRILELEAPAVAAAVRPGQFVHLHLPRREGAVLRRPFSVFKAGARSLSVLYKRVGRETTAMTRLTPGDEVSLIGPLGNGFPLDGGGFPLLVAGGYGVAPLYLLAQRLAVQGVLCVGAAAAADVLCVAEFERIGWRALVTTEDGSLGRRGLVTDALDEWLRGAAPPAPEFYACGPDGMLRAVAARAAALGARAWLSLDRHMGCGVGACLACVQRIRGEDGAPRWARVCREGPVFEAREVVWE